MSRRIAISSLVAMIIGFVGIFTMGAASAATSSVTASTSVSNHPDTTNASGPACTSSGNGPVWANDAYTSKMNAVSTGTNAWRVTIQDNGTFSGFADPVTCNALNSSGSFLFLYTVTVNSANTPSQATLHSSYSGAVSTTQMVKDFFGDSSATVTGGDYFASYQDGNYVQTTNSIYGDVVAATPPTPANLHQTVYSPSASLAWSDPLGNSAQYTVHFWLESGNNGKYINEPTVTGGHDSETGLTPSTGYCWNVNVTGPPASMRSQVACFKTAA